MKGVTILLDEQNQKRLLQIDLSDVDSSNELIEDLIDVIIGESEEDGPNIGIEELKRQLKSEGKI